VVPLIDMVKEAVLRTGCLRGITSVADRGSMSEDVLAERLLLAIYAYGTNTGIKSVSGGTGHTEDEIRYARRRYLNADAARKIAIEIADATFSARRSAIWGESSTAIASDSTHFGAYDQNIFTEHHSRYGRRGVLIYWSVERNGSVVVHSQLLNCSASEVHAMVDGAIHHGTEMAVESSYVDTHGQSEIGFGITKLLGFDLLPRIKRINKVKLYRPAVGEPDLWPGLKPAMTRPINWTKIAEQYDQMVKYATAIRTGTASTEATLRRFMKANSTHPIYQAMIELGSAQKTVFLARYLRSRELQREINSGLNVVEAWNGANSIIFYGKNSEIASNRRDEQEMSVLCLRICQAALVYVCVLMIQDILDDPDNPIELGAEDERGLTPLFWSHVLPYGEVKLNMTSRLALGG
jgi:TnpA family transposase